MNLIRFLATKGLAVTARVLGTAAHRLIEQDIQRLFPDAIAEFPVAGGIIDVIIPPNQIYEIKPVGGTVSPDHQIDTYINATNGIPEFPNGLIRGSIFFESRIDGPYGLTDIFYFTSRTGVIEYEVFPSLKLVVTAIGLVVLINTNQIYLDLGTRILLGTLSPVPI